MNKKILQLYGLKWNPFLPDVPTEALFASAKHEHFIWRLENQAREGGFALITGDPGTGKSVALRLVAERLAKLRDVTVGVLTHPQSGLADFYRELGHLFGVQLSPHNRWGGFKALRDKWLSHVDATLCRPVLLIDEAQEMRDDVLSELRLLSSADFDSRALLTVVLCGDGRLRERFQSDELLPLASRIRARLVLEAATSGDLAEILRHALAKASGPRLMTTDLQTTLCEHAAGNPRVMCGMAADLLAAGTQREAKQLDEKLYLEVFAAPTDKARGKPAREAKAAR